MKVMEVKVELEKVGRMRGKKEEAKEMVLVKLGSEEQTGEVLEIKRRLIGD